jgi:hypothetical protein
LFFTGTEPFQEKYGLGPYAPLVIAVTLGIPGPMYVSLEERAEYYIVVDKTLMPECTWWSRLMNGRMEHNCSLGPNWTGNYSIQKAVVKRGRTEHLNNGTDVIYPVLLP